MRRQQYNLLILLAVFCIGLLPVNVSAVDKKPTATQATAQQDNFEFILELYGWVAKIEGTTATGTDFEIDFDTIVENLDFTIMSTLGVRKNKWSLMTDVIYLNLDDDSNTNINEALQLSDIGLEAWIVNPFVAYEIMGGEKGILQLIAGARYLWIEVDVELKSRPPLDPEKIKGSGDGDVWDGVVGVRGDLKLTDRWFMPYRLDIGTGDSDYTWNAVAGIGYKFDKFSMAAAYRYMKWEFEDDSVLEDLTIKGPLVGAIFKF